MPTGRLTYAGGLTSPAIQTPTLSSRGIQGTRGNDFAGIAGGVGAIQAQPIIYPDYGSLGQAAFYGAFVPEVAKANFVAPSNQGHRAALSSRQAMMFGPRNTPSRSLYAEHYTRPIQVFAASNTWQLTGPVDSPGSRAKQPNSKFVSPFSTLPIPARMPWDL